MGVLGLEEAEHLRGAMHRSDASILAPTCNLALRSLGNLESELRESLIDERGPVVASAESKYQLLLSEQVFRFLNCATGFTSRQLGLVVQALEQVPEEERRTFWLASRSCRRRPQIPV